MACMWSSCVTLRYGGGATRSGVSSCGLFCSSGSSKAGSQMCAGPMTPGTCVEPQGSLEIKGRGLLRAPCLWLSDISKQRLCRD